MINQCKMSVLAYMVIRRMIPRTARIRFVFFMVKPPDGLFS